MVILIASDQSKVRRGLADRLREMTGEAVTAPLSYEPRPVSVVAGRLDRAFRNFLETFPLFAVALISTYIAGKLGPLTLYGSALYVICRALYAPLYASGVAVVRTVVWTASMAGIVMIIAAIFQ